MWSGELYKERMQLLCSVDLDGDAPWGVPFTWGWGMTGITG